MDPYSLSKTATIALFLHTQYPWHFKALAKPYKWTSQEISQARHYLTIKGLKPYGEK